MFRDIVEPSIRVGRKRKIVLPLSIITHLLLVAGVILTSLLAPGALPMPVARALAFVSRDVVLPPSLPPAPRRRVDMKMPVANLNPEAAPLEAPNGITPENIVDSTPALIGEIEPTGNLLGKFAEGVFAPVPPPPLPSEPAVPIRIGGNVRPPTKIKDVRPVYPTIAQAARVEGLVIIEATIGPTGKVLDAQLLRSIPLLDAAALEAVRQWEYTPTLLNGTPVPVLMTVTVRFALR